MLTINNYFNLIINILYYHYNYYNDINKNKYYISNNINKINNILVIILKI